MKKLIWVLLILGIMQSNSNILNAEEDYQLDLEKIVVTASKLEQIYKKVPNNISIISTKDIEDSDSVEIVELLDMLPSVNIIEYGSYGATKSVHTRGAVSTQVLTLVNGRPINTPRDGQTDHNQIPLSNIERIEVMRGPAATMYGANAVGGVINIITKTGKEKMETKFTQKAGTFRTSYSAISNGYKFNNFDYFLNQDYLTSQGHRDNAYYRSSNTNLDLGYKLNDDNRISLFSGYNQSSVGSPGTTDSFDPDDRTISKKKFFDLTWNGKILKEQDILLKLYHNSDRLEFIETFDPRDESVHTTKEYGSDIQFSQLWFDVWRTTFGGNYKLNYINSSSTAKHDYNSKALYVESETDLFNENAVFKIGARWDDYSNFGDRISPSASLSTWFFDKIKLHGLVARSFRVPTFNDLYWPSTAFEEGNPNLEPEKATSYETGVGIYLFKSLKLDSTYFSTKFRDLIEWQPVRTNFWQPLNVGRAKVSGLETELEYVMSKNLKINFNHTLLSAKDIATDNRLIFRPRNLFKCNLNYKPISRFKIEVSSRYKSGRFTDAQNTKALSPYYAMDLGFAYELTKNCEFTLKGTNILNKQYQEQEGYPMPGTAIMSGVEISF
ncbi:MAG: TonB-dependent receptor [Candidatus Omnitrophota bacterium]|nr:TonB-dependent receptor [Candidatus Omnitrophota bacterium]